MPLKNTYGQDISQAPGSIVPTYPVTPTTAPMSTPTSINSNVLASTPTINYQTPDYPAPYNTAAIPNAGVAPSAYDTLTGPQQQATELSNRIQGLNTDIASKATDTTNLYKQYGFGTQMDANGNLVADPGTSDLTAKLTALQNEALAIPQQLQLDATGRGETSGGLKPIETAALRNNSIQALGVSSLIAAKNGQLETAKHYVDQALAQKYGPKEAELKALTSNLNLVQNSPDYSNAEKKQAAQQQQLVAQQQAALTQEKLNAKDLQTSLVDIIGDNPGLSTAQIQVLKSAADPMQLALAATSLGLNLGTSKLPPSAQEYNFAVQHGYSGSYTDYQNEDANRKAVIARAGTSSSTPSTFTTDENGNVIETGNYDALTIGRYNKAANAATVILQKNPTFKNIIGSSAYLDRIEAAVQHPGSVGDQELLDAFTQLNTGGNRVTEAQVHLITNNQSLTDTLSKWKNKLSSGGALSNDQRNQIVSLAHEVYANYQRSYQPLYADATSRLKAQGVPPQFWNIPDPKTLSRSVSEGSGTPTDATAAQAYTSPKNNHYVLPY